MNQTLHRIFIGTDVSDECLAKIESVIDSLQKRLNRKYALDWALLIKIHFTLRFIGSVEEPKIEVIHQAIAPVLEKQSAFHLELKNIDFFPKNRPHVLVINLKLTEELAMLYANINKALERCDIAKETRVFLPHITLARFRDTQVDTESFAKEFEALPKKILMDKVHLYESNQHLREQPYQKLKTFNLKS